LVRATIPRERNAVAEDKADQPDRKPQDQPLPKGEQGADDVPYPRPQMKVVKGTRGDRERQDGGFRKEGRDPSA
jgi:hypothetical protein